MSLILLVAIDGVLQSPDDDFTAAIERDHRWRHGFPAFLDELRADPDYRRGLVGGADVLPATERLVARHVGDGLTAPAFLDRWFAHGSRSDDDLLDLLPALPADEVYLASTEEPRRGAHLEKRYGGLGWCTGTLFSNRVGYRKADTRYFDRVLRMLERHPAECLLVDADPAAVGAATAAGIPSIEFVDTPHLVAQLAARGIRD